MNGTLVNTKNLIGTISSDLFIKTFTQAAKINNWWIWISALPFPTGHLSISSIHWKFYIDNIMQTCSLSSLGKATFKEY